MKASIIFLVLLIFPFCMNSQIIPEWAEVYDGPKSAQDFGTCIATDYEGNVIIGGIATGSDNYAVDYMVVKYNPAGGQQWSQVYNGTGNWEDNVNAIAVDDDGDVYVTGGSDEGATGRDMVTVKYTSSGAFAWKSAYSGLGQDDDDWGSDIDVDEDGYVYVTGPSAGYSSSMWTDFATIKYSPGGDTVWTRRLGGSGMPNDRPTALALDNSGCIYVTGYFEGDVSQRFNYATVRYRPNGDTAWVRIYNGTGSDDDGAHAIAVDEEKNVYITGQSWGTYYDDYATIKYDSNGVQKWVARYNGPVNSYDKAYDLKLDDEGNVYVTGASGGTGINYDYCTIKYNADGGEEWVARYNGPDNLNDYAAGLALDNQGNVFVTGYSENAPSPFISTTDYVTVKYNEDGIEQWVHRYNGPGNYHDKATSIAVDVDGNVIVTGKTEYYQQQNGSDAATIKFAGTTSLEERITDSDITIYPNPSEGRFFISSGSDMDKIEIFNVIGERIYEGIPVSIDDYSHAADLSSYIKGVYFLRICAGDRIYIRKVILN